MKKLLFLIITITMMLPMQSFAITKAASPSAKPTMTENPDVIEKIDKQINNIKEKIASRVAELKLVEKRGMAGNITDISSTQIKVKDLNNEIRIIDVDELTKFASSSSKSNFGISDLTKGMLIGVVGNYNKDSKHILARYIDVIPTSRYLYGTLQNIDKKNYTVTVKTSTETITLDNEAVTKIYVYNPDSGTMTKSGFSKLENGEKIIVMAFPQKKDPTKWYAGRILRFTEISTHSKTASDAGDLDQKTPSTLTPKIIK